MIKKTFKFIHSFRVFLFVFICVSFLINLGINPVDIGKFFGAKAGSAIGMSVGVPENPFNKLALQLEEKEQKLNQKEAELNQLESKLKNTGGVNLVNIFLAGGVVVLFILISLNFYFDYKRRQGSNN